MAAMCLYLEARSLTYPRSSHTQSGSPWAIMLSFAFVLLAAALLLTIYVVSTVLKPGVRDVPGPWLAKVTNLYRVRMVLRGSFSHDLAELHRRYGTAVRIGPDCVSLSDRSVIQDIYGIRTNFPKVGPGIIREQQFEANASSDRVTG
jgi:hypothetical protein